MLLKEEIDDTYLVPAEAAVAWLNARQESNFELTGLANAPDGDGQLSYELSLVLCDGELCTRQQVAVKPLEDGFDFALVDAAESEVPALLDPPSGLRQGWLDAQLAKYEFILLLYYRGRW